MSYKFFVTLHNVAWRRALFAFVVFIVVASNGVLWVKNYFEGAGPLPKMSTVLIPRGTGFDEIAHLLEDNQIIRYPRLFQAMVLLNGNGHNFKAGEYMFPAQVSPRSVMDAMLEGKTVIHQVTIPEGMTSAEAASLLAQITILESDVPWNIPEGSLLPETYNFSYGDKRSALIARMQRDMQAALEKLWEKRDPSIPIRSPREAVILASIVEKETGIADERGRVAAVFVNRLNKGMKLQSDPTVIYALTSGLSKMQRPLTRQDLQIESAYNTYAVTGLPPGPICNPGIASLKAVLNPPKTDDIFFVANGKGGHTFSRTLKEHNVEVSKYRALQK